VRMRACECLPVKVPMCAPCRDDGGRRPCCVRQAAVAAAEDGDDAGEGFLFDALAELFIISGQHERALTVYLEQVRHRRQCAWACSIAMVDAVTCVCVVVVVAAWCWQWNPRRRCRGVGGGP
jgi:hypothetical protein